MREFNNDKYYCSKCGTEVMAHMKTCPMCDEPLDDKPKKSFWDRIRNR